MLRVSLGIITVCLLRDYNNVALCSGLKRRPLALIKKLRKAKKEAPPMEKPAVVKTHLRDMIVVPEMIGSVVGIHNGKTFNQVEMKVSTPIAQRHLNVQNIPSLLQGPSPITKALVTLTGWVSNCLISTSFPPSRRW